MAQTAVLAALLALVFAFFCSGVQRALQRALERRPPLVFAIPLLLTLVFAGASAVVGAFSLRLTLLVLLYALAPTFLVYLLRERGDFPAILLLWLPIEFAAGGSWVQRAQQGFLHSVAYGIAILLGLTLFLGFRRIEGMKFNLPRDKRDLWLPIAAYAVLAPVLIVVGVAIGFIPFPHAPTQPASRMLAAAGIIFAATALPEEIL